MVTWSGRASRSILKLPKPESTHSCQRSVVRALLATVDTYRAHCNKVIREDPSAAQRENLLTNYLLLSSTDLQLTYLNVCQSGKSVSWRARTPKEFDGFFGQILTHFSLTPLQTKPVTTNRRLAATQIGCSRFHTFLQQLNPRVRKPTRRRIHVDVTRYLALCLDPPASLVSCSPPPVMRR